jgi:outer membrane receptor protein involved in Fe transport
MNRITLVLIFLLGLSLGAMGGTVKGRITDARTGEPLVGSVVYLKGTAHNDMAGLDGSFTIRNVPVGEYELVGQFTGYAPSAQPLRLTEEAQTLTLSLHLTDKNQELREVTVHGQLNPEDDNSARRTEQIAPSVMNIVSAQAIQVSPDITVANVLQRVSGVTLERSTNGDGRYAVLRGMDKRYNYTLVNGIKIPSPDPYNRYVPLDIFPADLLQRLEVTKALTPSMEGDAIGGVVNMVMKDAPAERQLTGQLGTGYGQLFFDRPFQYFDKSQISQRAPAERFGPNYQAQPSDFPWLRFSSKKPLPNLLGNLTYGSRFGKEQQLGVLLAGSFQNTTRGSDGYFYDTNIDIDNRPKIKELRVQRYSTQQQRAGLNAKLDYRLNPHHTLRLYGVYLRLDDVQARAETDTTYKLPARPDVDVRLRSRYQQQAIANATLQGQHELGHLSASWSAVYSRATNDIPDLAEQPLKFTSSGNRYQDAARIWLDNVDQDRALYLNLNYQLTDQFQVSAGGLYRDKDRTNRFLSYQLRPSGQPAIGDIGQEPYTVFNPLGIYVGANNYTATEKITAGYGQVRFVREAWEVLGGARLEHTNQAYLTSLPRTEEAYQGRQQYLDVLPSLHVRYALSKRQNLRLSYFSSISRPSYFEITPYNNSGSVTDTYAEAGNPYLQRTQAANLDLRYEYFGSGNDQLLAGVFYKRIKNPIEYALVTLPNTTVTVYQPNNFGTATNYGFEWVGVKFWGAVGISTNYTFTVSEINSTKVRNNVVNGALTRENVAQQRPLQGQAKHVANASLLYKNVGNGLDLQLAYVYTGSRIVQVDRFVGLDYWQRAQSQLDFSAEKRLTKATARFGLTAYVKVQNILNTPYQVDILTANPYGPGSYPFPYQDRSDRLSVARQTYGAYYLTGLRFRL